MSHKLFCFENSKLNDFESKKSSLRGRLGLQTASFSFISQFKVYKSLKHLFSSKISHLGKGGGQESVKSVTY